MQKSHGTWYSALSQIFAEKGLGDFSERFFVEMVEEFAHLSQYRGLLQTVQINRLGFSVIPIVRSPASCGIG